MDNEFTFELIENTEATLIDQEMPGGARLQAVVVRRKDVEGWSWWVNLGRPDGLGTAYFYAEGGATERDDADREASMQADLIGSWWAKHPANTSVQ